MWPFTRIPEVSVAPPVALQHRTADTSPIVPPSRIQGYQATVTPLTALSLPAVLRAVQVVQTLIAQMVPEVWRGDAKLPTPSLILQPELDTPRARTIRRIVHSIATAGNAYCRVYRNDKGTPIYVEVLNPFAMAVTRSTAGPLAYDYTGYVGQSVRFAPSDLLHMKYLDIPGSLTGAGPLQLCRQAVYSALALESFSANVFGESGVPTGVLSSDDYLDPTTAAEYRTEWDAAQERRGTAVLGSGLKYTPIVDAESLQMLDARKYVAVEVARMFGLPAHLLAAELGGSSLTYATLQDYRADLVTTTLSLYTSEIEGAFSSLLPRGQEVRFATGVVAGVISDTETTTATNESTDA